MQRCLMESSPAEVNFDEAPSRVTVSHVLVKHVDVDRPAPGVTRSRGEACMRARQALEELKSGKDFEEVVKTFSDERGASTRAGSLGAIEPSQVDPAFARAAFALDIQQVSHVVESRAGFHIVLRTR